MSVGRTFEESLLKGIRSLEIGVYHLHMPKFDSWGREDLLDYIKIGTDDRIYAIAQLLRMGVSVEEIVEKSTIDAFFIRKLQNITAMEQELSGAVMDSSVYYQAKKMGFSDGRWRRSGTSRSGRCSPCARAAIFARCTR